MDKVDSLSVAKLEIFFVFTTVNIPKMSLTHKDDDRLSHDYVKSSKNLLRLYANKENCLVNWSTELGRTYTEKSIIRELLIKKGEM